MAVSVNLGFLFGGVLVTRALLLGVGFGVPAVWKLPYQLEVYQFLPSSYGKISPGHYSGLGLELRFPS